MLEGSGFTGAAPDRVGGDRNPSQPPGRGHLPLRCMVVGEKGSISVSMAEVLALAPTNHLHRRRETDDGVVVAYHSPSPSLPSRAWQIWPQPDFVGSICSLGEKERPLAAGDLRGTSSPVAAAAADLGEQQIGRGGR